MHIVSAQEIIDAGAGYRRPWSIMAAHLRNDWIAPGTYVGCVLGIDGTIAPMFGAEGDDLVDVAHPVRVNVLAGNYREAWIVTRDGATLIAVSPTRAAEIAEQVGVTPEQVDGVLTAFAGV